MWLEQMTLCQIVMIDIIMDLQYCPFQFNQNSRILIICFSSTTTRQIHNQLPLKVLVKISEGFLFAVQVIWVQKCADEVYLQHDS